MVNFSSAEKSTRLIKDIFEREIEDIIKLSYHLFMVFRNYLEQQFPIKVCLLVNEETFLFSI